MKFNKIKTLAILKSITLYSVILIASSKNLLRIDTPKREG